jgi:hypothetical protein
MLGWSFFIEGMRDACTDLLDNELGGTQRERIEGAIREAVLSEWPRDEPHTKGYLFLLAALDLYVVQADDVG